MPSILVVEDDPQLRRTIERILERDGHVVTVASSGKQALQVLETSAFDLMITDLVMPDLEGLQLLREVRAKKLAMKVIAMSGGGRGSAGDYLAMAALMGAAETLEKPFTSQQLNEVIGRLLPPS